ncbi:MAG: HEAT repeat domain-containing protein, partial [Haloferula sp.]
DTVGKGGAIADYVQSEKFDIDAILELAFAASSMDAGNIPRLTLALKSTDPVQRYWAVLGLMVLKEKSADSADAVRALLQDEYSVIRTTAGEALITWGERDTAGKALLAEVGLVKETHSLLFLFNTLRRHGLLNKVPKDWTKGKATNDNDFHYVQKSYSRKDE